MKKLFVISICLCIAVFLGAGSDSYASSVVIQFDPGASQNTPALTGFQTNGALMEGMNVTAYFSDGSFEQVVWTRTGPGSGQATGTNWYLNQSKNTFDGNWNLVNNQNGLIRLLIDAGTGNSVFDINIGDTGTPGSRSGSTFTLTGGGNGVDMVAVYRDLVGLQGNAPVGDLYRFLDIHFINEGGLPANQTISFIADTDNFVDLFDLIIDSDQPLVEMTYESNQTIYLNLKASKGEKVWILVEAPDFFPGLSFARPSDDFCEINERYVFLFENDRIMLPDADFLYYSPFCDVDGIELILGDLSGLGTIKITSLKGASGADLEVIQKVVLIPAGG